MIRKASLEFLEQLPANNNREWFAAHKADYADSLGNITAFAGALIAHINTHDEIETASGKQSLFRIYKDVRFSKEKTPYNDYWSGAFRRATKRRRGGYYFHIQPGGSFVAGGFWGPAPQDLQRIRQDIDHNHAEWYEVLAGKKLIDTFAGLMGDQVKSAPRGYHRDHPAISLLRYKQFLLRHNFTDAEVLAPGFAKHASDTFLAMRPFLDLMSGILTTDANGVSLID